jgi:hypothetical protein
MKRNITIFFVALALLFAGALAYGEVKTEYAVFIVEGTDAQLADIDKATFGDLKDVSWDQVLPKGWKLLMHQVKGVDVQHQVKYIKFPRKMLLANESMREEGFGQAFFLYGSRIEDQINPNTGRPQRAFFRAITTDGAVISGRELRQAKAESLKSIVRVIGAEITIISFI